MKKYKIFLLMCALCGIVFTGCQAVWAGSDTASVDDKVGSDFSRIAGEDNLYYANDTNVVYWIGGSYSLNMVGEDYTTSYMTPWIAPNGLPYIYDPEKREMKEIRFE